MLRRMKEIHYTLAKHVSTTYLFQSFMRQIKSDRQNEIDNHQANISLRKTIPNTLEPLNVYADGDSWFDYPLYNDMIEWLKNNAMPGTTVLDMAHYGDASTETLGVTKRQRMVEIWSNPNNGKFDAICVSMGGNDICGDQFIMWIDSYKYQTNPLEAIIETRFTDMMYVIESAYNDLVALRDQYLPNATIFTHGYDFVQPSGIGVCGVGPWLKPSLDFLGWLDPIQAQAICTQALLAFDGLMTAIESNNQNVVYVRTQGTLDPATDWSNELHPTEEGFNKLSNKLLTAMREIFPGRI